MADRIVVLGGGRIWQHGSPQEIYHDPRDGRVAAFVGSANLLPGRITTNAGTASVETVIGTISVPESQVRSRGTEVVLMSRPERWRLGADGAGGNCLTVNGTIRLITHLGPHTDYIVNVKGHDFRMRDYGMRRLNLGDNVDFSIDAADLLVLDPDSTAGDLQ